MVWYYRDGEENKGPFSDEEIEELVTERTVKGDTWVWREGMDGWKKYEDVAAVDGSAKTVVMATVPTDCTRCGKSVGLSNLRPHEGKLVCESCLTELKAEESSAASKPDAPAPDAPAKPAAAGAPPPKPAAPAPPKPAAPAPAPPASAAPAPPKPAVPATPVTPAAPSTPAVSSPAKPAPAAAKAMAGAGSAGTQYATWVDRLLARLIDGAVIFAAVLVGVVLGIVFARMGVIGSILGCVTWLALFAGIVGYEIYFLSKEGATIGKRMRGIKVVRSDGSELDTKQAIIRVLSSTFLGIGAIMIFFDEEERKALHDMIADTRVVQA